MHLWIIIALALILTPFLIILYKLIIKPKIEPPLPDELYEGKWTIPVPGIGILEGPVTTARKTVEKLWNKIIESANPNEQEKLVEQKKLMLNHHHFFAIKNNGEKYILLFNDNPLNDKYSIRRDIPGRFGATEITRFIHGVQDCIDLGEEEGFHWLTIKLKETNPITQQERKLFMFNGTNAKYLMRAAKNLEQIKFLQDEVEFLREELSATQKELAKERSEKERAKRALAQKSLTEEEAPEIKAGWKQIAKRFFSIPQIATCVIVYFLTPEILRRIGVILDQTGLSIVVGVATIATFFLYPPISNWIKRRL